MQMIKSLSSLAEEYQYILLPIVLLLGFCLALKLWRWTVRRLTSALNTVATRHANQVAWSMTNSLLPGLTTGMAHELAQTLPGEISATQEKRAHGLRELVKKLRQERDWVPVVVRLHGCRVDRGVFQGNELHAQVLMNVETGVLKPHPDCMIEHKGSAYRHMPETAFLGAPAWKYVPDDPYAIILLGVVYRIHYGRNQPVYS